MKVCGKPKYEQFKYCAKAALFKNQDVFNQELEKMNAIIANTKEVLFLFPRNDHRAIIKWDFLYPIPLKHTIISQTIYFTIKITNK